MNARKLSVTLLAVPLLVACGTRADTAGDEVAVHESGSASGRGARAIVDECVPPATNTNIGMGDTAIYYPAGGRTWEFSAAEGADGPPLVVAVGSPPQRVTVSGLLSLTLKTDCPTLNKFHASQGRKNWAGSTPAYIRSSSMDGEAGGDFSGWSAMLRALVGVPLNSTIAAQAQDDNVLELYNTETARNELAEAVLAALPPEVVEVAGGDFFTFTGLQITSAIPPQATLDALDRQATAESNRLAGEAERAANQQRYDTVTDCTATGLSESACVLLYGINSGKVPYLAPQGAVVVPGPAPVAP